MQSKLDITIGEVLSSPEKDCLNIQFHIKQTELSQINKSIQNALKTKKTPFFTMVCPNSPKYQKPVKILPINQEAKIINNSIYHFGNLSDQKTQLTLRKLEKAFHLLTASTSNEIGFNLQFSNSDWLASNSKNLIGLFNCARITGKVSIEEKTLETFKKVIAKISPQFLSSPIMAILQIFENGGIQMEIQDLETLEAETKKQLCKQYDFSIPENDQTLARMCDKESSQGIIVYLTMQKLFSVEIQGPARLIGPLICTFK